jgi:hypothetical protein
MTPAQLGRHVTRFPGRSIDDLVTAIHNRTTRGVTRPIDCRLPLSVYALQSLFAWLLPYREQPAIARIRARLLAAARLRAPKPARAAQVPSWTRPVTGEMSDR